VNKVVLLCGLSCVGKTVGGEILAADRSLIHFEASAEMRLLWRASGSLLSLDAFAERSLSDNPSRVPMNIIERARAGGVKSLVVSGLRSRREVDVVASVARDVRLVIVRADPAVRLRRCLARGRAGNPQNLTAMLQLDLLHERMGLSEIAALHWATFLANDGTIDEYRSELFSLVWP
jgi:AAA domain-containing protein